MVMIKKEKETIKNFQKSTIQITRCKECKNPECEILYDRHHDQHFSYHCGTVIIQSQEYQLDYPADPYYWEKEFSKRRDRKRIRQEKEQITQKLKKWKQTYIITEKEIQLPDATLHDEKKLINLCKNKFFKIKKTNIKHQEEIIDIKYSIILKDKNEIKKIKQKEQKEKEEKEENENVRKNNKNIQRFRNRTKKR